MEEAEMAAEAVVDVQDAESEEISDSFLCCVCLELLYKPVVLACGHISCFWCIHMSMSGACESHCPICRHPYLHFPSICWTLHNLLSKMYPDAYKRREAQISEEERSFNALSPQIDNLVHQDTIESKDDDIPVSCPTRAECGSSPEVAAIKKLTIQEGNTSPIMLNETSPQVSKSDCLCISCKELLFHPIVLNCGHVYCEGCLVIPANEKLKCKECECLHPGELPNVCLDLDHFLEEQFPEDYAKRKCAAQPKGKRLARESSKASARGTRKDEDWKSLFSGDVHLGYGCDYCGMYPIVGDRYRCQDCTEEIGFDLCGDCYNSRSKILGRFNQQHKPDHELMKVMNRERSYMLTLMSGILMSSPDAESESPPIAPSPGDPVPSPPMFPGVSELELSLPFQFPPDPEDDLSETEAI